MRLTAPAALLAAALLAGCAHAPAAPMNLPVTPAPPAQVRSFELHGPADSADLLAALDTFRGQAPDAALRKAVVAYVRDYYGWLEWRHVGVIVDSAPDTDGTLHVIVTADPPADLDAPPAALAGDALTTLAAAPVDDMPVPAPRGLGGARAETALDASFGGWLQTGSRVLIDANEKRLYLKRSGGAVVSYAVAVGTPRTPTPPGDYTVEAIRYQPTWYPPASIRREYERKGKTLAAAIPPGEHNPLGDWFVRLQNGIGIHGTNQPRSIGRAASHGCIRMHDGDVAELVKALKRGDGITIVRARGALATATR